MARLLEDPALQGPQLFCNDRNSFSNPPEAELAATIVERCGTENIRPFLKGHIIERYLAEELENEGEDVRKYWLVYNLLQQSVPVPNAQPNRRSVRTQIRSQIQTPDFKDFAVGKLTKVDKEHCHFCHPDWEADFGVNDESLYLPQDAADGFCTTCHATVSENSSWIAVTERRNMGHNLPEDNVTAIVGLPLKEGQNEAPQRPPKMIVDGGEIKDIGRYFGPVFCKGCPWGQIDVNLAKICGSCQTQRVDIVKHHHHPELVPLNRDPDLYNHGAASLRCMICLSQAYDKCTGCPLRLCTSCSILMRIRCK